MPCPYLMCITRLCQRGAEGRGEGAIFHFIVTSRPLPILDTFWVIY
jgi:hypothetical protein